MAVETPRPLFIPDLTPSPHAYVDMKGEVGCIGCGRRLPLADAEVVGLGFRCPACSRRAALDGTDEASHLTAEERTHIVRDPPPRTFLLAGLALLAVAAVMWVCGWDVTWGGPHYRRSLFVWVFIAGVGVTGIGWFRWLDRRAGRG